jgi:regulator of protease activity HflC (stomatin/prohibitin superfamily)
MKIKLIAVISVLMVLVGCGTKVEVPPANVGKILTKNGFAPETVPPSKFRLPACLSYCDRLVLLEASDNKLVELLTVFMPKDKLNITVDIRGTYSIPTSKKSVDSIYSKVVAQEMGNSLSAITAKSVYATYGQQAVRGIVRSEITKYSISEVLAQREVIGQNIHAAIAAKLAATNTPISISRFELANIQPPAVIVKAQESAKEREIDIQKAEAEAQIDLVKAERALEIAKKDRLVKREEAESIAEQNRIAAKSITPQLLAYRKLETAERIYTALAKSNNVVIVPADSSGFSNINDNAVLAKLIGREFK